MGKRIIVSLISMMLILMVFFVDDPGVSGLGMDTDLSASDASFIGENADDESGHSVASAGDVNGDGYDDILIGVPDNDDGGNGAGQTYLIFGKASGWSMDTDLSNADASFIGEDAVDFSGWSVAGAGDVNDDGYDDILIGAYWESSGDSAAGQTYLILGKASGWQMDTDLSNVDASFIGEERGDYSGKSVAGVGDVNGDGYDDILIGADGNDEGGGGFTGQTYLILGKASGWAMDTDLSNADASFWGAGVGDLAGYSVAGAGDVNGDGYDDILIGARKNDDGDSEAGQTYLILGKASGWSMDINLSNADASFIGEEYDDESGSSVTGAGDVNGDGYDDILIGASRNDDAGYYAGQTYLILGKASGWSMDTDLSNVDASFLGEGDYDYAGYSVAGAGDVDGDGYDDILIGARWNDDGGDEAGQTYLILGKASGWTMDTDLSDADASFWGEEADDSSGGSVAGAGDVNGDGRDDVLIGAYENDDGGSDAGQTYLIFSSEARIPIWHQIPILNAVEDVPFTYDFSANVSDPDDPIQDLEITSVSPYVTSVDGLDVTFEFPNGVLEASVPLVLTDGSSQVPAIVDFTIQPVNDPPEHDIPEQQMAMEDEPWTMDLSSYVWDIDNDTTDLFLIVDSPHATANGLMLNVLFTEPIEEYDLWFNVSDGIDSTPVMIHFNISLDPIPPGAPTDLTASAGDGYVNLYWDPPLSDGGAPILGYRIYRSIQAPPGDLVDEVGPDTTFYNHTGLQNGQTYLFTVTAYNKVDQSLGVSIGATPLGLPLAPLDLSAVPGDGVVEVNWTPPSDTGGDNITEYKIFRGISPGDLEEVHTLKGTLQSYNDMDVVVGTTYYYAVAAVTSAGVGPLSTAVSAMPYGLPSAPENLVATPGDGKVELTWEPPLDDGHSKVLGYVILREPDLEIFMLPVVTSFVDNEIVNGVTYNYSLAALNIVGPGEFANVTGIMPAAVPDKVVLGEHVATKKTITLEWSAPEDDGGSPLTGYIIYRGLTEGELEHYKEVDPATTNFTDDDVKPGKTYWYTVVAKNDLGDGEPVAAFKVKVPKEEESPALGGAFVLLAMLVGVAALMMRRKGESDCPD